MGSPPAGRADGGPGAYDRADGQRGLRSPRGEERRLDDLHARWKSGRPLRGHARDYSRAAHRVDSRGGITANGAGARWITLARGSFAALAGQTPDPRSLDSLGRW